MSTIGRTTALTTSQNLLAGLTRTQNRLFDLQNQISSGVKVNRASDEPSRTASVLLLQSQLEAREQKDRSLQNASAMLNSTDAASGDITNILIEAHSEGLSALNTVDAQGTVQNTAAVIDEAIKGLLGIANRTIQDVPLFGGSRTGQLPFEEHLGGIRYVGGRDAITTDVGLTDQLTFNASGEDVFGALASRVKGAVDLDPGATPDTLISDLAGAQNVGIRRGTIVVSVNGTQTNIDLSDADTLGDVVLRVNDVIDGQTGTVGALSTTGSGGGGGLQLTAAAGQTISISSVGTGQTAQDLGIATTATSGTVVGEDLQPKLTLLTELSSLGATIDFSGGLKITQGAVTKIADFSNATTIQEVFSEIEQLDLGIRAEINADGTGIDLINEVSGLELSIGENAGGTTAGDLGVRTFGTTTRLEDFRKGAGVEVHTTGTGAKDFGITLHDGQTFEVDIRSASTVGEVIDAVKSAASAAGVVVGDPGDTGTNFNFGLALDGNGFALEDNTTGTNNFQVTQSIFNGETSLAATHLGIYQNAGTTDSTIAGEDLTKVRVESVFTHLSELRDAMKNNDKSGIGVATNSVEQDVDNTALARATIGVMARRVEDEQNRSFEMNITEQQFLSQIRDTDMTEAITTYNQVLQQLQASLQLGSTNLQLSLLDFLR